MEHGNEEHHEGLHTPTEVGLRHFILWVAVNSAAGTWMGLSYPLVMFFGSYIAIGLQETWGMTETAGLVMILGLVSIISVVIPFGIVGFVQSLGLRKFVPRSFWWAPAAAFGSFLTSVWIAVSFIPVFFEDVPIWEPRILIVSGLGLLAGGAVLGLFQWLILRRHTAYALWWIPANAVGMLIMVGFGAQMRGCIGCIGGLLAGAVTSGTLALLLRQRKQERVASPVGEEANQVGNVTD